MNRPLDERPRLPAHPGRLTVPMRDKMMRKKEGYRFGLEIRHDPVLVNLRLLEPGQELFSRVPDVLGPGYGRPTTMTSAARR